MSVVAAFEDHVLMPALGEIVSSQGIQRDYHAQVLGAREALPAPLTPEEKIRHRELSRGVALKGELEQLAKGHYVGPTLILAQRERKNTSSEEAGVYVMTTFYSGTPERVFVAPWVIFWMAFNGNRHAFPHRYDNAIADHPIEKVTKQHVHNHVLNSNTFFKMYANSPAPFPGYRSS